MERLTDEEIGRALLGAKSISVSLNKDGIFFQTDGIRGLITVEQADKVFPVISALMRARR